MAQTAKPLTQDKKKKPPPATSGAAPVPETGGQQGPEPTRYGDWEKNGRCSDF